MLDFILNGIVWVLALYGFIEIVKTIYYACVYSKIKTEGIYFIIAVKNQEEQIEGFMRSILFYRYFVMINYKSICFYSCFY